MSLADIRKKIELDAAAEAKSILDEANRQVASIRSTAEAEIAQSAAGYDKQYEAEVPEIRRRAEIVAELDVKKLRLGAKQELLSQTLAAALDEMVKLSSEKYLSFVGKLLDQTVVTGDEEVQVGPSEKHITSSWLAKYNESQGKKLTLAKETADIRGGFILRRGKISENCSFEMLIRWLKDDLESELVKRLFDTE